MSTNLPPFPHAQSTASPPSPAPADAGVAAAAIAERKKVAEAKKAELTKQKSASDKCQPNSTTPVVLGQHMSEELAADTAPPLPTAPGTKDAGANAPAIPDFDLMEDIAQKTTPANVHTVPPAYLGMPAVKEQYASTINDYKTRHDEARSARDQLAAFKQSCNKNPPHITLPRSLLPRFATATYFKAVPGEPAFYKASTDTLLVIERKTVQEVYDVLIAAKEKHLAHLRARANTVRFVTETVANYSAFVGRVNQEYAEHDAKGVDIKDAIAHFERFLHTTIEAYTAEKVQAALKGAEQKKADQAADFIAQEQIMNGSHDGSNIEAIVEKKVNTLHSKEKGENSKLLAKVAMLEKMVESLAHQHKDSSVQQATKVQPNTHRTKQKHQEQGTSGFHQYVLKPKVPLGNKRKQAAREPGEPAATATQAPASVEPVAKKTKTSFQQGGGRLNIVTKAQQQGDASQRGRGPQQKH
jgi:hypothetical protein